MKLKSMMALVAVVIASGAIASGNWPALKSYEGEYLRRVKMPIGGIGTGTISLSGRGALVDWEIRNNPDKGITPVDVVAPAFMIRTESERGDIAMRLLEGPIDTIEYEGPYGTAAANHGFPRFSKCVFKAAYPLAQVCLEDAAMPVKAMLEAMNPLVKGDEEASGIPAALLRWQLINHSSQRQKVSICGFIVGHANGELQREALSGAGLKAVRIGSKDVNIIDDRRGEILLGLADGNWNVSHATNIANTGWMVGFDTFVRQFVDTGKASNVEDATAGGKYRNIVAISAEFEIAANASVSVPFVLSWRYPHRKAWTGDFKSGKISYAGQFDAKYDIGNHYATVFKSALSAAEKLLSGLNGYEAATLAFVNGVLAMKAPAVVKEAALFNLSTLRTETCHRAADGHFFGWEGIGNHVGSCYGNCTHVWGYEHALIDLWPNLAKDMTETQFGPAMAENGCMGFRVRQPTDYSKAGASSCGNAAADGQMQCIIKAYENWKKTNDSPWLKKLYPRIRKAMEFCWIENGWDGDRDGVMEGCQHNTMDVDYFGPNPQMEFLYLAALKAMAAMADEVGEGEFASECLALAKRGSEWTEKNLFNGEYYEHQVWPMKATPAKGTCTGSSKILSDPDFQLAAGCLIDQLLGDSAARHVGLGAVANVANAKKTLDAIIKYNTSRADSSQFNNMRDFAMSEETAIKMAWYPKGRMPKKPFPYYVENMTGFEYIVALNLAQLGDFARAEKVVRDIRNRYDGRKRSPFDEAECGHHYARALAAWSVLMAFER